MTMTADLIISGQILEQVRFSPAELRLEIAIYLYSRERLSIGQAQHLAGLDRITFQKELAKRDITIHFEPEDLHSDLKTLGL
jgi:predicted HTH domain antitoxin